MTPDITPASRKRSPWLWILLAAIVLLGFWLYSGYNRLVTQHENVDTQWSIVETQYQRRADLVPNLVNTVKGAANFEQSTFTAVTAARSQWQQAAQANDRTGEIRAAQQFDSALSRLLVTVEAYPQLQATQAFRDLMVQLEGTENRINVARIDYNNSVRDYNLAVRRFPSNIVASLFGYEGEEFFSAQPGAENAPAVNFDK
jgi:LemA protein